MYFSITIGNLTCTLVFVERILYQIFAGVKSKTRIIRIENNFNASVFLQEESFGMELEFYYRLQSNLKHQIVCSSVFVGDVLVDANFETLKEGDNAFSS